MCLHDIAPRPTHRSHSLLNSVVQSAVDTEHHTSRDQYRPTEDMDLIPHLVVLRYSQRVVAINGTHAVLFTDGTWAPPYGEAGDTPLSPTLAKLLRLYTKYYLGVRYWVETHISQCLVFTGVRLRTSTGDLGGWLKSRYDNGVIKTRSRDRETWWTSRKYSWHGRHCARGILG